MALAFGLGMTSVEMPHDIGKALIVVSFVLEWLSLFVGAIWGTIDVIREPEHRLVSGKVQARPKQKQGNGANPREREFVFLRQDDEGSLVGERFCVAIRAQPHSLRRGPAQKMLPSVQTPNANARCP